MPQGTVKKVNDEKGFGFIDHGTGKDIFFHVSGMRDRNQFPELQEGNRVSFDSDVGPDGRERAINVAVVSR